MNHARLLVILILMPLALILLVYKQSQPFMRGKNHSTEQTVEIVPGPFITWWDNGQMLLEINNKHNEDGVPVKDGLTTRWYRNGQKEYEENFKDAKIHGPFKQWHENGQKMWEINYKEGKTYGLRMRWHKNGQKMEESNYKDSKKDGLVVKWHENGQKKEEGNYKNGKLISGKFWNSKGEPVANTQPKPEGVNKKELEEREGIIYLKGSDTPYTGNP